MTENSFYWAGTSTHDAGPYAENTMWKVLAQIAGAGSAEGISDVYGSGVFYAVGNKLEVTLDGSNLDVDSGAGLVDGAYYENDAAVDITVDVAAAGDERIDYIVLRKCYSGSTYDPGGNVPAVDEQEVRITVIKGTEVTPPAAPSAPSLTQDTSRATYWDVPLATVEVDDTGATSVTDARESVLAIIKEDSDTIIRTISGNNRGTSAVDLQYSRSANTQVASGNYSTISGGSDNTTDGDYSFVGGGDSNTASGDYSFIGGGTSNTTDGDYSFVGGGDSNTASGDYSFIGGGTSNTASDTIASVVGGSNNTASAAGASVVGGTSNTASGSYSTASGGKNNTASDFYSTISGGIDNTADSDYSTISGGSDNTASGDYSFVGGGDSNTASGVNASISGGDSNTASGRNASISGGLLNTADGDYSFAGGREADTNGNNGVFIWADSEAAAFTADRADQFKVRASGGAHFVQNNSSGAIPVMIYEQEDTDEPFTKFIGDAAADDLSRNLVDEGDQSSETREGWFKVEILDDGNQITDDDYFVPFYSLSA